MVTHNKLLEVRLWIGCTPPESPGRKVDCSLELGIIDKGDRLEFPGLDWKKRKTLIT
jgi:hypothetical protein